MVGGSMVTIINITVTNATCADLLPLFSQGEREEMM
jgi:hypothetical protein